MSAVLDEVKSLNALAREKAKDKRAADLKEYAALLAREGAAKKDDPGRLIALAESLGISLDQMDAHADAIAATRRADSSVATDAELESLHNAQAAALQAHTDAEKEWAFLDKKLRAAIDVAGGRRALADRNNQMAANTVARLRADHPMAFGLEAAEPPPAPEKSNKVVYLGGYIPHPNAEQRGQGVSSHAPDDAIS